MDSNLLNAYKKALIAYGHSLCASTKKLAEQLGSGKGGLTVYRLVAATRNGSPVVVSGEDELILFTASSLYDFAGKTMADVQVLDDGEAVIVKHAMHAGDEQVKIAHKFKRFKVNEKKWFGEW